MTELTKNAVISTLIASLFATVITGAVNWGINRNEVSAKYVEIAVHILSPESKNGDKALRGWAVDVINEYAPSSLKINGDLKAKLINGETNFPLSGRGSITLDDVTGSGQGTVK